MKTLMTTIILFCMIHVSCGTYVQTLDLTNHGLEVHFVSDTVDVPSYYGGERVSNPITVDLQGITTKGQRDSTVTRLEKILEITTDPVIQEQIKQLIIQVQNHPVRGEGFEAWFVYVIGIAGVLATLILILLKKLKPKP